MRRNTRRALVLGLHVLGACAVFTPKPWTPAPVDATPPTVADSAPVSAPVATPEPVATRPAEGANGAPAAVRAPAPAGPSVAMAAPANVPTVLAARRRALVRAGRGMPADEVGYYLDVFAARVRQLRLSDLAVARQDQRLLVDLTAQAQFESGTAVLTPTSRRALASVTTLLKEYDQLVVSIHAQADPTGYAADDKRLSEQRALAVALQFTAGGVAVGRILVVGHGGSPVLGAPGSSARERVVLWLDPLQR